MSRQKPLDDAARARVNTNQVPTVRCFGQEQVVGVHEPTGGHVDQAPIEHIFAQQYFAGTSFETPDVERLTFELYPTRLDTHQHVVWDKEVTPADAYLETADPGIATVGEPDDHVLHSPNSITGWVDHGPVDELAQQ